MASVFEEMLVKLISEGLKLEAANLRLCPSALPKEDRDLFGIFDVIPGVGPVLGPSSTSSRLSGTYKCILDTQSDGDFLTKLARNSFADPDYWLGAEGLKIPKYSGSVAEILEALRSGPLVHVTCDSSEQTSPTMSSLPLLPGFVENGPAWILDQDASSMRVSLELQLEKAVKVLVSPGSWFSQGLFVNAYNNRDWMSAPQASTWEDVFGSEGVLRFVCTGAIAARGMTVTLKTTFVEDQVADQVRQIWPCDLGVGEPIQWVDLKVERSLEFTSRTTPTQNLLLAVEVGTVSQLLGG